MLKFIDHNGLLGIVGKEVHAFQKSRIEFMLALVIRTHRRNMRAFSESNERWMA